MATIGEVFENARRNRIILNPSKRSDKKMLSNAKKQLEKASTLLRTGFRMDDDFEKSQELYADRNRRMKKEDFINLTVQSQYGVKVLIKEIVGNIATCGGNGITFFLPTTELFFKGKSVYEWLNKSDDENKNK